MSSYNYAKYLHEAINSVLNQSFLDYELFIQDDASTDESWSIIQSYSDPRISSFRNIKNQNDKAGMRKVIFEMASGEYIAIHHSDNVWESQKLKKQVDYLDAHPDVGAVFTNAQIIDENGEPFKDESHFLYKIFDQPNRSRHEWLNFFFYQGNALCHPSILIRKKCYDECGFYRAGFAQLVDFDMWVRLCMKYEIHVIPEKLIRYRVLSDESYASGNRPEVRIRGEFEYLQVLDNYLKIPTYQDLVKIFPSAQSYYHKEGCDIGYVLGMVALETGNSNPVYNIFGLSLLFKAINDPDRARRINELYGFRHKDFIALTAHYDVFSIDEKNDLHSKLKEITNSKKWKAALLLGHIGAVIAPESSLRYRMLNKLYEHIVFLIRMIRQNRINKLDISLVRSSGLFDETWYLAKYPDVAEAKIDPCKHYLLYGGVEGRDPGPKFSGRWYLDNNIDVNNSHVNPLLHYIKHGEKEGRSIRCSCR